MALFKVTDYDKKIWQEELADFLPDKIFDIHVHLWLDSMKKYTEDPEGTKRVVTWPSLVALDNSIEDLMETYRLMFPGKDCGALLYTNSFGEEQNDYIEESMKKTGLPGLYFSHPKQSAEEVRAKVLEGGYVGLKSYLSLSPSYLPEAEIRIYDFFPKHQLKLMDEMGGIIMLHIPRNGRLKDPVNIEQILEIKAEFPNIKLIIAHIGRAYNACDIGDAFERLSAFPDLLFDITANCCETAIREVLRSFGSKNVLFGTDMPILRMRTHRIEENGTYINLIPPGLYGDPKQDSHLREVTPEEAERITFFAYEELLALKRACATLGFGKSEVGDVMYGNAIRIINEASRSIYGKDALEA